MHPSTAFDCQKCCKMNLCRWVPQWTITDADSSGKLKPKAKAKIHTQAKRPGKPAPKPISSRPEPRKETIKPSAKAQALKTSSRKRESSSEEEASDEESREIAYLERKLGIKDGKTSKSADDGLDGKIPIWSFLTLDLLDGILEPTTGQKRKNGFDDGRSASKFRIAEEDSEEDEDELEDESESSGESDEDDLEEESEFKGFSDSSESEPETAKASDTPSGRYVPPAARKEQPTLPTHEEDPRLRKQIQGMLNR
jgi:hypothetical protein